MWYIIHCNNQFCVKNALNNWANRKKSHLPLDMTHILSVFFLKDNSFHMVMDFTPLVMQFVSLRCTPIFLICYIFTKFIFISSFFFKLNIKPLPSGKFLARGNRRRSSVGNRRRSSVGGEALQQLSQRRTSREVIQRQMQLLWSFLLSLVTGLWGILRGDEHLNENG